MYELVHHWSSRVNCSPVVIGTLVQTLDGRPTDLAFFLIDYLLNSKWS